MNDNKSGQQDSYLITKLNASKHHRVFRVLHLIHLVDGSYTVHIYVDGVYIYFGEICKKSQPKEKEPNLHCLSLPLNDEIINWRIWMIDALGIRIGLQIALLVIHRYHNLMSDANTKLKFLRYWTYS